MLLFHPYERKLKLESVVSRLRFLWRLQTCAKVSIQPQTEWMRTPTTVSIDLTTRVQVLEEENQLLKSKQTNSENTDKCSNLILQGLPESVGDGDLGNSLPDIILEYSEN